MSQFYGDVTQRPLRVLISWPKAEPPFPTSLVERCEAALELPLEGQTLETLRLLIGQNIGTRELLPLALSALEEDILASGDMYDGDLASACLRLPASFWKQHPEYRTRLEAILEDFDRRIEQVNKYRAEFRSNNPFGARL